MTGFTARYRNSAIRLNLPISSTMARSSSWNDSDEIARRLIVVNGGLWAVANDPAISTMEQNFS